MATPRTSTLVVTTGNPVRRATAGDTTACAGRVAARDPGGGGAGGGPRGRRGGGGAGNAELGGGALPVPAVGRARRPVRVELPDGGRHRVHVGGCLAEHDDAAASQDRLGAGQV